MSREEYEDLKEVIRAMITASESERIEDQCRFYALDEDFIKKHVEREETK